MSNPKGIVVQKYGYICSRYSRENTIDPQRQQEVAMHTTVCGRGNTQKSTIILAPTAPDTVT